MNTSWTLRLLAWLMAAAATLGALFLGEVMGMTPCVLCWYQRIFMFPLAVILGIACFLDDRRGALYALPLALGGVAMSAYHTLLIAGIVPKTWVPCGPGPSCTDQSLEILGGIQIPWLSLAAFLAVTFFLLFSLRNKQP